MLPDGDSLLFSAAPPAASSWDVSDIVVQSLATGERRVLVNGGSDARYVSTGHIVYAFEENLLGIAFNLETLSVSGGAVPLVQGVVRSLGGQTGTANYEIAANGTLVYLNGELGNENNTLVWVDRQDGGEEPINVPPRAYQYAQLSADGSRIGLDVRDQESDIWIWDVERETLQRLTFDPGVNRGVTWSPDGSRIAFSRAIDASEEVYWQAADGSGTAEQLTRDSVSAVMPNAFTPDGSRMLYMTVNEPRDVLMVDVNDSSSPPETVLGGAASEQGAAISPDGRWLAYQSDESGQDEVYVRPFPDVDSGRWQISTNGGTRPLWSRDGSELFYFVESGNGSAVMVVSVDAGDSFIPRAPETLLSGAYLAPNQGRHVYDISPDGQRFLMIKAVGGERETPQREIVVVENWFEELKRLVPVE